MVVNNLEVSGGYQKLVLMLSFELRKMGHDVIIYTPVLNTKACYPELIKKENIVTISKGRSKSISTRYEELSHKIKPDTQAIIIHDELSLAALSFLSNSVNTINIWMLNNQLSTDFIHYGRNISDILNSKTKIRDQITDINSAILRIKHIRRGLKKIHEFAVYDENNKKLVRQYLGKEAVFVGAGADLKKYKEVGNNRNLEARGSFNLLSVGVMYPHRRYEDIIIATNSLIRNGIDVKLTIVGRRDLEPHYSSKIDALINNLQASNYISILDIVSDKKMLELYSEANCFIFVNDGYTWGISVFEAIAAKLPVIISKNIGAADLIKNDETGIVVNPKDPKSIEKSIMLLMNNTLKKEKIVENAFNKVLDYVSWSSYAERMWTLIAIHTDNKK